MSKESTKPYLYFERIMNGIVSIPASVESKLSNVMLVRRQELDKRASSSSASDSGSSEESASDSEESASDSEESRTPFSVVKSWFSKRTEFPSNSSNSVQEQSSEEQSEEPLVQKPEHLFEMKCNIRGW